MIEQIYAQQVEIVAGNQSFNNSIFKGDPSSLVEVLGEKGIAPEETVSLLSAMNYGAHRQEEQLSQFVSVQERLADHVIGSTGISLEEKENFSEWIVSSSNLLGIESTDLDEKLAQTKNNFLGNLEPSLEVGKSRTV